MNRISQFFADVVDTHFGAGVVRDRAATLISLPDGAELVRYEEFNRGCDNTGAVFKSAVRTLNIRLRGRRDVYEAGAVDVVDRDGITIDGICGTIRLSRQDKTITLDLSYGTRALQFDGHYAIASSP